MNHCMILPVPLLERYGTATPVMEGSPRMHLCLNHLLHRESQCSEEYHSYYLERREAGDYVIMDNGADEHAEGDSLGNVLEAARSVRAQEIVLPDVQYEALQTRTRTTAALRWLETYEGQVAYNKAHRPRLQVVPQGQTYQSWQLCAIEMIDAARMTLEKVDGPSLVVGVAKQYHSMFANSKSAGRVRLVEWLYPELQEHEDVHLLGYPRKAYDLQLIERKCPGFVRSVDSAKPAVYAYNKMKIQDLYPLPDYPLRPDGYFGLDFDDEQEACLGHNIWKFCRV